MAAAKKTPPSSATKKVAFSLPPPGPPALSLSKANRSRDDKRSQSSKRARLDKAEKEAEESQDNDEMEVEDAPETTNDCDDGVEDIEAETTVRFLELKHKKPVEIFNFFGEDLPAIPKASFLLCLEHLTNKEIYTAGQVNMMWSRAAFDQWQKKDEIRNFITVNQL
eukprot:gene5849-6442_t